jgi:signal transduction histidine kinase/CHASE3 domain sensor protein/CheY-like chemotaxis protein
LLLRRGLWGQWVQNAVRRAGFLSFIALAFLLIAGGLLGYRSAQSAAAVRQSIDRSYDTIAALNDLLSVVQDAETGQRGYFVTGREAYLAPYRSATERLPGLLASLTEMARRDADAAPLLDQLHQVVTQKLAELAQTVQLRRSGDLDGAYRLINTDEGKTAMDQIHGIVEGLSVAEHGKLDARLAKATHDAFVTTASVAIMIVLSLAALGWGALVLSAGIRRERAAQEAAASQAALLRTTIESVSQGIAAFDARQTLVSWNQCFAVLLSIPPDILFRGASYQSIADHLSETGQAPFLESPAEIAALGSSGASDEVVVFDRKRGEDQVFELRRSPLADGGFVITCTDHTDRAKAETRLRHAQRMEALGQLTGGLAHDFNNLLQVVLANLDLLVKQVAGDSVASRCADAAIRSAEQGATMTRQLLAFARRQPLAPMQLNVGRQLADMHEILHRALGAAIDLEVIAAPGLWMTMADAAQLESVILNLVINARDAMPGGGKLTIEAANAFIDDVYARQHSEVTPGQYVMLAVSDTGVGMSSDVAARAFEPFFTTKPEGKGTGLGLAQVFGFVKQSRGHVKIYSEPGAGTTIKLYLPRALAAAAARTRTVEPASVPRGSETVLVVEDDDEVRAIVLAQLAELGYTTVAAADAEAALAIVESAQPIDLLFTDVVLPGAMRGGELARRTRERRPGLPVLFTSGYTQNSIVHDGVLDDGALLISKPYRFDRLAEKLREALERPADVA